MALRLPWQAKPKKGGRPTKDEYQRRLAQQRAEEQAARKARIAELEAAVKEAELEQRIQELRSGLTKPMNDIQHMAATMKELREAGVIPRNRHPGDDDDDSMTKELIRAVAPAIPQILQSFGALRNTGHLVQEQPAALAGSPPTPQPEQAQQVSEPAPPAFADVALSGAFRKRSPADAADWLWANREKWPMVQGVVVSVCNLPDEQLPGYLAYLAQHFPRTVAWLQTQPAWWGEVVSLLRQKAATAA